MGMATQKTVHRIVSSQKVNLGPELIDQALPNMGLEQIDPFLLIHHASFTIKEGMRQRDAGVPPHPHRGFSPVTFVFTGSVAHQDSLGNKAEVDAGGTQWMHAGRGIVHSERPGQSTIENGGENEFIQFWVNTPAAHKMDPAHYQPISDEQTPKVTLPGATIGVVAGEYEGVKGPAPTLSPQLLLRLEMSEGSDTALSIPQSFNCLIYLLDGQLTVNGKDVKGRQLISFNQDGTSINIKAHADTRAMLLSGEPINEPVLQHGPFVMNNQTQILEAMRDSQMGKMGILIEEF